MNNWSKVRDCRTGNAKYVYDLEYECWVLTGKRPPENSKTYYVYKIVIDIDIYNLISVLNNGVFVRYSYRTKRGPLSGIKQIESILGDSIKFKKSKYLIRLN